MIPLFDGTVDQRQCRYCAHWDPSHDDPEASCGLCRRNPPEPAALDAADDQFAVWPETAYNAGCGDFSADGKYAKPSDVELFRLRYLAASVEELTAAIKRHGKVGQGQ